MNKARLSRQIMTTLRKRAFDMGITTLAERTGLARETLYRTLQERGNPRLATLTTLCAALNVRLHIE